MWTTQLMDRTEIGSVWNYLTLFVTETNGRLDLIPHGIYFFSVQQIFQKGMFSNITGTLLQNAEVTGNCTYHIVTGTIICKFQQIQGVPELVLKKPAVIASELEVTVWSGTFQKLLPVLKFPFQTARWHSTRAELLRSPASHHGVVYRCGGRWNDSMATMIARVNTPRLFCVRIR